MALYKETNYNGYPIPFNQETRNYLKTIDNNTDEDVSNIEKLILVDKIRQKRDELLKETDFRVLEDSPGDKNAWKTYRQALRDLTETANTDVIPSDLMSLFPQQPQ